MYLLVCLSLSSYLNDHPGGPEVFLEHAGLVSFALTLLGLCLILPVSLSLSICLSSRIFLSLSLSLSLTPLSLFLSLSLLSGKNAGDIFREVGHSAEAVGMLKKFEIGVIHDPSEESCEKIQGPSDHTQSRGCWIS